MLYPSNLDLVSLRDRSDFFSSNVKRIPIDRLEAKQLTL